MDVIFSVKYSAVALYRANSSFSVLCCDACDNCPHGLVFGNFETLTGLHLLEDAAVESIGKFVYCTELSVNFGAVEFRLSFIDDRRIGVHYQDYIGFGYGGTEEIEESPRYVHVGLLVVVVVEITVEENEAASSLIEPQRQAA